VSRPSLLRPLKPPDCRSPECRRFAAIALLALIVTAPLVAAAQSPARRLATIDALRQFPGYFHLQNVVVRGEFVERGTELILRTDDSEIRLVNPSQAKRGPVEVRGQVIDVGRLERDDSRLGSYAERRGTTPWPVPGAEVVLSITAVSEAQPATRPSVRALALEPWKFEGQKVTLVGNFRGRNLFGDLPEAPGKGRYDFVLGAAEGAVWVTGARPRGRGFDLDVERRRDTNRWIEVTGVVSRTRGLVTIAAGSIELAAEPDAAPSEDVAPPSAPPAPLEVVFSAPVADDTGVSPSSPVRIQFSRELRGASIANQVRVGYLGAQPGDPLIEFKLTYDAATRALQVSFARPLEPFRTVRVDLLPGITAFDGGALQPWSLTYSVGAR
jgi:hypothetical protein